MNYDEYRAALEEADRRMKARNGHQFVTILKTRCANCGKSPKAKTRCGGWFQTFVNDLGVVLEERGVISTKDALRSGVNAGKAPVAARSTRVNS